MTPQSVRCLPSHPESGVEVGCVFCTEGFDAFSYNLYVVMTVGIAKVVSSLEKGKRDSDEGDAFWLNTEGSIEGVRHPVQRRESELGIKGESRHLGCWLFEEKRQIGFDPEIRRSFSPSSAFHHTPRVSSWEWSREVCFLPTVARIRRFFHGVGISDVGLKVATDGVLTKACPPAGSPHRFLALFTG